MENYSWADTLDSAITVCDAKGVIVYMNGLSAKTFSTYGENLVGRNIQEFHNPRSNDMIEQLLKNQTSNAYTIEKNGVKKLIKQSCWYHPDGTLGGLVELSIIIPTEMSHHVR